MAQVADGLGRARAGGGELPESKRTRTIGALIVCEGGDELDAEVQIGERMLDVEPGRLDEYTGQPLPHDEVVKARKNM
jgi:hypothetical protein